MLPRGAYCLTQLGSVMTLCSSASISSLAARRARFRYQGSNGQLDVLRDGREEPALIAGDRVSGHTEPLGEFALRETEAEPLTAKLPAGQVMTGYLREHGRVNV